MSESVLESQDEVITRNPEEEETRNESEAKVLCAYIIQALLLMFTYRL